MKKIITFTVATVLSIAGFALTASAHQEDENVQENVEQQHGRETVYEHRDGGGRLDREVNHLNRMLEHVRGEMREYHANRHARNEFEHLRAESYQLNNQFRRGAQSYDRRRLRAQIEHMHGELHHLEQEMHVRAEGFYQWR